MNKGDGYDSTSAVVFEESNAGHHMVRWVLSEDHSSSPKENCFVKEATRGDAISIGSLLNVNKETVWKIIKGMKYSTYPELAMAVHKAFSL